MPGMFPKIYQLKRGLDGEGREGKSGDSMGVGRVRLDELGRGERADVGGEDGSVDGAERDPGRVKERDRDGTVGTAAEAGDDAGWRKKLDTLFHQTRVSRMEALDIWIHHQVERPAADYRTGMKQLLGDAYYCTMHHIQTGTGVGASFAQIDDRSRLE